MNKNIIVVLVFIINTTYALIYKADLKIYENTYNIYYGKYIYSNNDKKILINYTNPINIYDFYDYNNNLRYKFNNSNCNTFNINEKLPELYIKSTDTTYTIDTHIKRYVRNNNLELYTYDNVLYKINFKNKNIIYEFSNYEELTTYNFNFNNFNNICNNDIYIENDIINLLFVIDESENIIEDDFNKQIDFIFKIIQNYTNQNINVRIALIGFSTFGRLILNLNDDFNIINSTLYYLKKTQIRGNNCIGCGLMIAEKIIEREKIYNPTYSNHIILLTEDIVNMPNYNNNCERNILSKFKFNYCFGCCNKNYYASCDNILNSPCNNTDYNVIIPIEKKNCKEYFEYNYNNSNCLNCECKKDIDDNYYLYCSKCSYKSSNSFSNCYNYQYYNICSIDNSINYLDNLTNSLNIIKNNNINLISIIKGFNLKLSNNISIDNYDELFDIVDFVINKINSNIIPLNNGCNINCKGFCGLNGNCLCPECKTNEDNYCYNYKCNSDGYKSTGCYKKEIICQNNNKCEYPIKNSNNPLCCEYKSNASNCDLISKCSIGICNQNLGCKSIPISCDDNNPCTIDSCNNINGCVHKNDTSFNCSVQYEGKIMIKNCYKEGNICKPAIYIEKCECKNICEIPYYNSNTKSCECKNKNDECNKLNTNSCFKGICVNGECKIVENITKTYECMDLVPEDGYAGFCNIETGLCDRKQIGTTHLNNLCYNFGCNERNTKCKRFKCENDNNYNIYCINYWNMSLITNDKYIKDKCDDNYGLDRTIYNSYISNCYNYTYNTKTKKYIGTYLCPPDNNAIKYSCYNDLICIPISQCPTYKDNNNLCLIFDRIENNECIYINKTCNTYNKCMNSTCDKLTGKCIETPINLKNTSCYNYYCDNNTGIIQKNKLSFDDEECYNYVFYEENNKCNYNKTLKCKSNNPCEIPICNLKNKCDTINYNCYDNPFDECFTYYCNPSSSKCEKNLRIDRFIDYCDLCVIKYGNLLNVNKSLCINRLYPYDFIFSSSSSYTKSSSKSSSNSKSSSYNDISFSENNNDKNNLILIICISIVGVLILIIVVIIIIFIIKKKSNNSSSLELYDL